jgi:hypothetical protein
VFNGLAELLDPTSIPHALRNAGIDVITSKIPGGYLGEVGVELYKESFNELTKDNKW